MDGAPVELTEHVARLGGWCADCGESHPGWASRGFGVTLCLKCAGCHRSFGSVSRVASLELDSWSPADVAEFVARGGNKVCNAGVAGGTPAFALRPDTAALVRQRYCEAKWLGKGFDLGASQREAEHVHEQRSVFAGILRIDLIHGRNLKAADLTGKSDPYVVFGVGHFAEKALKTSHAQSTVKRQTLNPDWNETFMLNVSSLTEGLTVQVWDYDPPPKHHDNLGNCHVDLTKLKDGETLELALPLSKKGLVRFSLTWTSL